MSHSLILQENVGSANKPSFLDQSFPRVARLFSDFFKDEPLAYKAFLVASIEETAPAVK